MGRKMTIPAKPAADGSMGFVLRGGPHDALKVRLYPHNRGWERLCMDGIYEAPPKQDKFKPFLQWDDSQF